MRILKHFGRAGMLGAGVFAMLSVAVPAIAAEWIGGHYGPEGHWIPGHWVGNYSGPPPEALEEPPGFRPGRFWIAGHYGPGGHWIPGHWR
jgi:hypothetical protein